MSENDTLLEKIYPYRWQILFILIGLLCVSGGIFIYASRVFQQPSIEVINDGPQDVNSGSSSIIVVEVSGAVQNPGVYTLTKGSRIDDALKATGDVTSDANSQWMSKYINRAAPLNDGQKIYIPSQTESESDNNNSGGTSTDSGVLGGITERVNINTASQSELESLWGIGPVTAKNIIEQRMYSSVEELLSKGILKQNVYDRNKDILTVY